LLQYLCIYIHRFCLQTSVIHCTLFADIRTYNWCVPPSPLCCTPPPTDSPPSGSSRSSRTSPAHWCSSCCLPHIFDIVLLTSGMYHHICPPLFGEESHLEHLDPVGMEWIPEFFLVYILAAGSKHCVYLGQCKCEDWDWSLIADLSLTWMLTCEDWSTVGSRLLVLPLPLPQT